MSALHAGYTIGSLFSGIGGIDLAAACAGFDVRFQVEIDEFCRKVLNKHARQYWPRAVQFTDVRSVGSHNLERVDVLAGGFPCQDLSYAGQRAGIQEGTRSGLWFEFRRIISEIRPRMVVLENVAGILTLGGTGVLADLAEMGYVGQAGIVSAFDTGAPHQRERWVVVAYATSDGRIDDNLRICDRRTQDSNGQASIWCKNRKQFAMGASFARRSSAGGRSVHQPHLERDAHGLSRGLDAHRWPAFKWQQPHDYEPTRITTVQSGDEHRHKALGNAVCPQVFFPVFLAIREYLDALESEAA